MKKTKYKFKIVSLTFTILMSTFFTVKAQVVTRVLSPDDRIENYIPWYNPNERIPIVQTPLVDVEAVLEDDIRTGREMPRIGIKQDVNYNTRDGQLIDYDNYSIWNLVLHSENAKSMSVRFDNTILSEEAIMFLYNEETRFVVGPISNKVFKGEMFRSDYLNGDRINITVFIPYLIHEINEDFIHITTFDHGILPFRVYDDDFEDSEDCNVNVACDEGNGWECQVESVCKIIHSDIGSCTGSLINNDCCDLTPYILTANHCVAGFSVNDYIFRFNYQSPQCTPNGETTPAQWIQYFGSIIRANWGGTDFSLLELNDVVGEGVSFAGWDRTPQTPPNSTYIHHPSGDVKKITFDAGISQPIGNFYEFNLTPGNNGDFGTLEGGSSGCPKFNPNRRIIGQQHGGIPWRILCDTPNSDNEDGRFDVSWEGNGTNDSQLRNWLGASTNPFIMDCMEHPEIIGPDVVCTSPEIFELINIMPCAKDVDWRVEPTNLFDSPTFGSGNSAKVWAKPNVKGPATITYTLTSDGCDPATLEREFWVGGPVMLNYFLHTDQCLVRIFNKKFDHTSQTTYTFFVRLNCSSSSSMEVYTINPGENAVNIPIPHGERCEVCVEGVMATNECGSIYSDERKCVTVSCREIIKGRSVDTEKSEGYNYDVKVFPNPTNDLVNLQFSNIEDKSIKNIKVLDLSGKVVKSLTTTSTTIEIDISNYPQGLYFIQSKFGDKIIHNKILKL